MKVLFFSREPIEKLMSQQYSLNDINILKSLGYDVIVTNSVLKTLTTPCSFYFSWWASGSIIPLVASLIYRRKIFVIVGGNEATLYQDSVSGEKVGYSDYSFFKKLAVRIVLKMATKCVPVSEFLNEHIQRISPTNTLPIKLCVDSSVFFPADAELKYISMICNTHKDVVRLKRLENFIRAMPRILERFPSVKFRVIGQHGSAHIEIVSLAKSLGLSDSLIFDNLVPNTAMPDIFRSSICYVQISDVETFGVAILESVACGTPVVTSRRGAIPEIFGDIPYYCDHNDVEDISLNVCKCIADRLAGAISMEGLSNFAECDYSVSNRRQEISNLLENYL